MAEFLHRDPRVRLAMNLGDRVFESAETVRAVYRGVLTMMEPRFQGTLQVIRRLPAHEQLLVQSCSDDVASLFQLAGSSGTLNSDRPFDLSEVRLAVVGCFSHDKGLTSEVLSDYFTRGGVLVTSDKAIARLPLPSCGLYIDEPSGPQRGRLVISRSATHGWDDLALEGGMFASAVTLDAGHVPIDVICEERGDVLVLAHEALGGRPLVVVARVLNGWLVHAVPHWFQTPPGMPTEVERRPLATMAQHIDGFDVPRDASVGLFMVARAMVFTLLSGLEIAFACRQPSGASGHH